MMSCSAQPTSPTSNFVTFFMGPIHPRALHHYAMTSNISEQPLKNQTMFNSLTTSVLITTGETIQLIIKVDDI